MSHSISESTFYTVRHYIVRGKRIVRSAKLGLIACVQGREIIRQVLKGEWKAGLQDASPVCQL